MSKRLTALALGLALTVVAPPREAHAFCGFYVGGAGARLFNNATQVVLMREGLRTVLTMANDYQGPPERFAMVVPVPVVLQKENVKTLTADLFERIDALDAPRLVEYWEQDPCHVNDGYGYSFSDDPLTAGGFGPNDATIRVRPGPVQVLNRFSAGEYEIVILGAQDSLGLERWLKDNGYAIPSGAEPVLRPYVQAGMRFFVAKVDPRKVRFVEGHAALSPLRFHYDTDSFSLPVRLGLLNSAGTQDLVIHVLARGQRYEVANYDNVVVPTNLDVGPAARGSFGKFYGALFDRVRAAAPHAVITEYSWDASTCDPCPGPALDEGDLAALGAEVFPKQATGLGTGGFVLTRLHARYDKGSLGADLVFRAAPPIAGGREQLGADKERERGAVSSAVNNFQARYAIRHPWTKGAACDNPRWGVWGGNAGVISAQNIGLAERTPIDLANFLGSLGDLPPPVSRADPSIDATPRVPPPQPQHGGCAGCVAAGRDDAGSAAWLAGLVALAARLAGRVRAARRRGGVS